jgi:hypothetical protein
MFEIPQRTVTMVIPDGDFAGAEIVASRDVSFGLVLDFEDARNEGTKAGTIKAITTFADQALVSWNLSRNGEPIPATSEELLRLPPDLVGAILSAWGDALKGTPAPLGEPSQDGEQSEAG